MHIMNIYIAISKMRLLSNKHNCKYNLWFIYHHKFKMLVCDIKKYRDKLMKKKSRNIDEVVMKSKQKIWSMKF